MPQIGPGKVSSFETHNRDLGRLRVTGALEDAYAFRTPSLRNVTQTAPYGHSGAYATLEDVIRHHIDPIAALDRYDTSKAILPELTGANDFNVLNTPDQVQGIADANTLNPIALSDDEISALIAFLSTLDDPVSLQGRLGVPEKVPSGLPVEH